MQTVSALGLVLFAFAMGPSTAHAQPGTDPVPDRDGDSKADDHDACPDEPEDDDGFDDTDGCPDDDDDGDAVPDAIDSCVREPETKNGFMDEDGCPDDLPKAPSAGGCADGKSCKAAGDEAWKAGDQARAALSYKRACALGDVGGCGSYGILLEGGKGVTASPEIAVRIYRYACGKRVREACHNLGLMTRDGRGVHANPARAQAYFGQACDLGLPQACTILGRPAPAASPAPAAPVGDCADAKTCDDAGWAAFVAKRYDEAARHGRRGCDLGAARACAMLGHLYDNGYGVPKDLAKGLELAKKACAGKEQSGCHNVAFHLEKGDVVPADLEGARRLYDAACKTGLKPSCDALAKLPKPDLLAPAIAAVDKKDYRGAVKIAAPLCDGGDMDGCAWLALARWELGQKKDAVSLWERACQGQIGWACREAADIFWDGEVGPKDEARGMTLAVKGCDLGDGDACFLVGKWSNEDELPAGVPAVVGFTAPIIWMERACTLGSLRGCQNALLNFAADLRDKSRATNAMKLALIACEELHDGWTCVKISTAYCNGDGLPRDPEQCRRYSELGCRNGIPSACGGP